MSTVVGIVNENGVWMGADSAATTEGGESRNILFKKMFRNKDYLFGITGSIRGGQVLFPEHFTPPKKVHELPDAIREQFREKGCIALASDDQTEVQLCNFLVGYKGKLYEILVDFAMNELCEYDAIGSGSSFAFGALYTIRNTNLKPEQRIKIALRAATHFDTSTAPPFNIKKL
jgi:ATP-dependent protease HslVU (ClpYQ) peptidase subunit